MAKRKIIITVAQTGAFHGKEANPNIPLTPQEIADSAYDCYNAGAAIVHIHAQSSQFLKKIHRTHLFPKLTVSAVRAESIFPEAVAKGDYLLICR